MAITFEFKSANGTRRLHLRHNPYNVTWNYNLITNIENTYGGQVIQVLGVNIDQLALEGQIGREGAFGLQKRTNAAQGERDRFGAKIHIRNKKGVLIPRSPDQQYDYQGVTYPGLHAMTEFFREYFAQASQGNDPQNPGQFSQLPMTVTYGGAPVPDSRFWPQVIPINFPSFKRSNAEFAPEWRIEFQVLEADSKIQRSEMINAISRLQEAIGFKERNPFSDPNATNSNVASITNQMVSNFRAMLPGFTQGDLENMIWQNISIPIIEGANIPSSLTNPNPTEVFAGEVTGNAGDIGRG